MYNSAFAQQVSSTKPNYEYCDLVLQKYMSNVPHDPVYQSLPFLVSMTVVAVMTNYFMFTGIVLHVGTASTVSVLAMRMRRNARLSIIAVLFPPTIYQRNDVCEGSRCRGSCNSSFR